MERTTTPMSHKRRGFSVMETLVVLAIGAGIIGAAAATINTVTVRNDANNIFAALSDFERDMSDHLRRRHVENTGAGACTRTDIVGSLVTNVTLAGGLNATGATVAAAAAPWLTDPCQRVWRSWTTNVLKSLEEVDADPTAETASYDADGRREFYIGSPDKGYDVGTRLNAANANTAAGWAGVAGIAPADADLVALTTAVTGRIATGCPAASKVMLAMAVDSQSACEVAIERLAASRWRQHADCLDPAAGIATNTAFVQGDSLLLACYD